MSFRPSERNEGGRRSGPVGALAAVLAVTLTLFLGLYMAQADGLQVRNTLPQLPTRISDAVALFPTRPIPTSTPTLAPSSTPSPTASNTATVSPSPVDTQTPETTPTTISPADCPERIGDWEPYTVQRGETVASIAGDFDVEISFFREVNCLGDGGVTAGMELFVPPAVEVDLDSCVPQIPAGWVAYTVRSGDNVFRLALQTNITVAELRTVNCLQGQLYAGTTIYLPFRPAPPPPPTNTPLPPPPTNTPPPPPPPTNTPPPPPTNTPVPPTSTPPPPPTSTPAPTTPPPTETPVPPPTNTPPPPTPTEPPPTATPPSG